jgi:hypothetical protein
MWRQQGLLFIAQLVMDFVATYRSEYSKFSSGVNVDLTRSSYKSLLTTS